MTPCATSRTQACARTFSKDFPVRSSGAPLRVFHRVIMQAHALVQTQPAARAHTQTKCAPIAISPQVSPLLCTALTLAHTSCTHTCTPIRRARLFSFSCRRARCLRNPVVLARLRLLAGGRQHCAETAVRMAECVSRSGWTVAALTAHYQRKAQSQETASRCAL